VSPARKAGARRDAQAAKADPHERLRRVLFLVPYAVQHRGIPVKELAARCGVSEKELLEDLDFLLGVGCPPFAPDDFLDLYVEGDRVYVALHQSFSRPPRFTESEAAALGAAAQALGGEGKDRALAALRQSVPRDRRKSFDELMGRIYAGSPPAPGSVLGRLQRAIAERREVRLRYFTATRSAEGERTVRPWTLAQRFGHWYLYGFDLARDRPLPFRLDRIRECALGEVRFEAPSAAQLAKARLFSEAQGEPVRVRLAPRAAAWALSRPGVTLVERGEDGGALVEVPGASEDWATRFALSFGGDAEVIAPPSARRHFAETIRRSLARYG
jgi:proteasome accessory factor C